MVRYVATGPCFGSKSVMRGGGLHESRLKFTGLLTIPWRTTTDPAVVRCLRLGTLAATRSLAQLVTPTWSFASHGLMSVVMSVVMPGGGGLQLSSILHALL